MALPTQATARPRSSDALCSRHRHVWCRSLPAVPWLALGSAAAVIIDAAAYYRLVRRAMAAARHRILIIGWDFDTRIQLEPDQRRKETLGRFILSLARNDASRRIGILKWSFGAKKQFLHPSAVWMLWRWARTRAIDFHFDSAHPPGCSHHQKIVVIDDQLAVCGGIDIAKGRWDTPHHADDDPHRRLPNGKPYPPWHDVTMMLTGPVAAALGELGRDRWLHATHTTLEPVHNTAQNLWPGQELPVEFENVAIGIARTRACYDDLTEIREIEALYLDMIAAARRFIYIENQYFTSAQIASAIAKRLQEPEPPEFVLIMPRAAEGWLEQMAMDAARVQLVRRIAQSDRQNRFRIYVPVTRNGADIYVHAKVSIVDDRLLRIGSSNLNNRSLGLDSECDVIIDSALEPNRSTPEAIAHLRTALLSEHLGVAPETFCAEFERRGSLVQTIESLRDAGKTLDLLDLIAPGPLDEYIAENELLDPESADGFLEPMSERGLKKRWSQGVAKLRRRTSGLRHQTVREGKKPHDAN